MLGPTPLTFRDFTLSGRFTATAEGVGPDHITAASFSTVVDVRETGFPCQSMPLLFPGVQCVGCPDEPDMIQCLVFYVIDLQADVVDDLTLIALTQEEIDANPACTE